MFTVLEVGIGYQDSQISVKYMTYYRYGAMQASGASLLWASLLASAKLNQAASHMSYVLQYQELALIGGVCTA